MSYLGFFNDTTYRVTDGNIVYASDLNNPMAALETGISSLVDSIQTGATIKTATDTGLVNAYVMSLTAAPTALTDGLEVWLKPAVANTGASTLNLNDLGAKAIRTTSRTALVGGELLAGYPFLLKYVAAVDSWLIVSDPGSTELDTSRTVSGGDGITVTTDEDSIVISVTDGGIDADMLATDSVTTAKIDDDAVTTAKIVDGAITQDKIASLPDIVHNDIIGGDITRTGANELTVAAVSCWDSTRTVWLEKATTTVVTVPAVAGIYQLAVVRLIAGSAISVLAYENDAAIAADATINAYRWLMEWPVNSATELVVGYSVGAYFTRGKASESVISNAVGAAYATVDHSTQMTASKVELIDYGCRDASVNLGLVSASIDGTNLSHTIGYTSATVDDTNTSVWGASANGNVSYLPFLASMQFKSSSGTVDLLVKSVKYKR